MDKDQKYIWGWLGGFTAFLTADLLAARTLKVPTFSRAISNTLPWWIVIPGLTILLFHAIDVYRDKALEDKG
jgi:uncharacterized membrane protein YbhN (UPF0104 family)